MGEHSRRPPRPGAGDGTVRSPRWAVGVRSLIVLLGVLLGSLTVVWLVQVGHQAAAEAAARDPAAVAIPPPTSGAPSPDGAPPGSPPPDNPPQGSPPPAGTGSAGTTACGSAGAVVVHVAGAVVHPGVQILPLGSRVTDAVTAAGGPLPTAQVGALNLAALVADGSKIVVPTQAEVDAGLAAPAPTDPAGPVASSAPVNINTATAAELDRLPGVGPVLAERILAWRQSHGPFGSVEELEAVPGIGAKLLAALRPLVVVS